MKAVVFDMDGVLLDTERVMNKAWARAGIEMDFKDCKEAGRLATGRNREGVKKLFAELYPDFDYAEFNRRYHEYMQADLKENGVPIKKGVIDTLKYLKDNKFKIAVATSTSSEHAIPQLKETGIFPYLDEIMTGDTVERGKPDPEIYLKACEKLGINPQDAYAVEDSANGLKSAYLAEMKPIYIKDIAVVPNEYRKYIHVDLLNMQDLKRYIMVNDVR